MQIARGTVVSGVAAIAAVCLVAGCGGGSEATDSKKSFKISAIAPLSGDLAAAGASVKCGLEGAVAYTNAHGGIDGRTVELSFLDDKGEAMGRPVGVAVGKGGALLVADDVGGRVWRVTAAGSAVPSE